MIIGVALHYLKTMLVGVVCISIIYYPYQFAVACGMKLDGAAIVDITGALEEMLKKLPIIGELVENLFSIKGAILQIRLTSQYTQKCSIHFWCMRLMRSWQSCVCL